MTENIDPTPVRSRRAAFFHALPAIALILSYLWLAIVGFSWALAGTLFGGSLLAFGVCLLVLGPCGLYLSARFVPRAITAERYFD